MHTVSRLISAPIEFIFPCRTLAGIPFSESLYLLISSYNRGSACSGRAKLMEIVTTSRLLLVPTVGVEPTRPYGQRILSPFEGILPDLTKRDEPIFTGLAAVKVLLHPVTSRDKMS